VPTDCWIRKSGALFRENSGCSWLAASGWVSGDVSWQGWHLLLRGRHHNGSGRSVGRLGGSMVRRETRSFDLLVYGSGAILLDCWKARKEVYSELMRVLGCDVGRVGPTLILSSVVAA